MRVSLRTASRWWIVAMALNLVGVTALSGCAQMNRATKGAIIGGAAGGVVGGVIGKQSGSTTKGAIIGAVVGGAAGAIIGHQMDKQARELEMNIPGARVQRVGEGIQVTFESGLLFDFDSATIKGEARRNLDELSKSLLDYPKTNVLIAGHTDHLGSENYNQGLSERRAASAAGYVASRGVNRGRLETVGLGESEPVASNGTDSGREQNRRVEVAIYASDALREQAKREAVAAD